MDQRILAAMQKRPDWRNPGKVSPFAMPAARPQKVGPEGNLWFHSPNRLGVQTAPTWFRAKLDEVDPNLEATWNFHLQRWMCWVRVPRIQNQYARGWNLLFVHNGPKGEYLPLDERFLARIHTCDTQRSGGSLKHFDRVMAEIERDKEKARQKTTDENVDIAMESFEHAKIRVGYGKSNGSKFSTYHSW
jgi:hypothetical protein